jgi:hypothetical protein
MTGFKRDAVIQRGNPLVTLLTRGQTLAARRVELTPSTQSSPLYRHDLADIDRRSRGSAADHAADAQEAGALEVNCCG